MLYFESIQIVERKNLPKVGKFSSKKIIELGQEKISCGTFSSCNPSVPQGSIGVRRRIPTVSADIAWVSILLDPVRMLEHTSFSLTAEMQSSCYLHPPL